MEIKKHFKITNWTNYNEVESIGGVSDMVLQPSTGPIYYQHGLTVRFELWLNEENGNGWEIRTYTD